MYAFQGQFVLYWSILGSDTHLYHLFFYFFVKATLSPSGKDKKALLEWQNPNEVCFPCSFLLQTLSKILLGLQLLQSQDPRSELPLYIHTWVHTHTLSASMSDGGALAAKSCPTFVIPWTVAWQAPLSMGFPMDKNTGMDCHSLLQGIFSTQRWNSRLLHSRQILYRWATREAPMSMCTTLQKHGLNPDLLVAVMVIIIVFLIKNFLLLSSWKN